MKTIKKSEGARPGARKASKAAAKEAEAVAVVSVEEAAGGKEEKKEGKKAEAKVSEEKLRQILVFFDALIEDSSVPRNVRATIGEAKQKLAASTDDLPTGISATVYSLDEVSNDINLPMHARTIIWNILSELEALKEQLRKK